MKKFCYVMNCMVFENNNFDNKVDITCLKYYIFFIIKFYYRKDNDYGRRCFGNR